MAIGTDDIAFRYFFFELSYRTAFTNISFLLSWITMIELQNKKIGFWAIRTSTALQACKDVFMEASKPPLVSSFACVSLLRCIRYCWHSDGYATSM